MAQRKKCLDTYALVEIADGNPKFAGYLKSDFILAELTLAEFYTVLLREHGEETADFWIEKLRAFALPADIATLIEAVKFRHQHRKARISFLDAVGYVFARKNRSVFATGDKEFERKANVEFRKR